jgi:hypothetical protein
VGCLWDLYLLTEATATRQRQLGYLSIRSDTKLRFTFLPDPSLKHVGISMYDGHGARAMTSLNLIGGDQWGLVPLRDSQPNGPNALQNASA